LPLLAQGDGVDSWLKYFPLDDPRPEQSQAISFAIDAFVAKKKRFVILEMGVGCGKSATGIAIAEYMNANVAPGSFKKNGEQRLRLNRR
jgi:Rad3-related DNA helicase